MRRLGSNSNSRSTSPSGRSAPSTPLINTQHTPSGEVRLDGAHRSPATPLIVAPIHTTHPVRRSAPSTPLIDTQHTPSGEAPATPLIEGTKISLTQIFSVAKFDHCMYLPSLGPLYQRGGRRFAGRGVLCELVQRSEGLRASRQTGRIARIAARTISKSPIVRI